jgi:hypothetical protein
VYWSAGAARVQISKPQVSPKVISCDLFIKEKRNTSQSSAIFNKNPNQTRKKPIIRRKNHWWSRYANWFILSSHSRVWRSGETRVLATIYKHKLTSFFDTGATISVVMTAKFVSEVRGSEAYTKGAMGIVLWQMESTRRFLYSLIALCFTEFSPDMYGKIR